MKKKINLNQNKQKKKKWFEEYQIIYSYEETVILKLFEHGKKEIEIGN